MLALLVMFTCVTHTATPSSGMESFFFFSFDYVDCVGGGEREEVMGSPIFIFAFCWNASRH